MDDFSGWSRAKELYERAVELEDNGEIEAALEHYERAVSEDPAFGDAYVEMAYLQLRMGDERRAVENLRRAIRVAGHPLAYYNLGWIYEGRRRPERAEILYRKAIAASPEMVDARLGLAALLLGRGAVEESATHLERAAALGADAGYVKFLRDSALPRYREYAKELAEAAAGGPDDLGQKERVYLDLGAILLGSAGDDGISVPLESRRRFARPVEVAVTAGRFLELCGRFRWRFDAVAADDAESLPLADLLANELKLPRKAPAEAGAGRALLVRDYLYDAREYFAQLDALESAGASAFVFVLALSPDCFRSLDYRSLPQAVGLVTDADSCWLPPGGSFEKTDAPEAIAAAGARLAAEFKAIWKPEANLAEQLAWYDQGHSHLNFPLRAGGGVRRQ